MLWFRDRFWHIIAQRVRSILVFLWYTLYICNLSKERWWNKLIATKIKIYITKISKGPFAICMSVRAKTFLEIIHIHNSYWVSLTRNQITGLIFLISWFLDVYTSPLISKENINAEMCAFKNRDGLGLPSWLIQFLLLAISTLSPWLLLFRMHSVLEKWKYIEGMVQ